MNFKELEKQLPEIADSLGNYHNCVRTGNLMFLSGRGPVGKPGLVGRDISKEAAYA
jgi:hypothetical protein